VHTCAMIAGADEVIEVRLFDIKLCVLYKSLKSRQLSHRRANVAWLSCRFDGTVNKSTVRVDILVWVIPALNSQH